eukprot:scaffold173854_cov19-Tisochrysis_lutea.AAC.1
MRFGISEKSGRASASSPVRPAPYVHHLIHTQPRISLTTGRGLKPPSQSTQGYPESHSRSITDAAK